MKMKELANALGVDAVLLVRSKAIIELKGRKGKLTFGEKNQPLANGLVLDLFSADKPKIIWSAAVKKEVKWPTEVKSKSVLFSDFIELNSYAPDMKKFFETYGELAAINLVMSSKQ